MFASYAKGITVYLRRLDLAQPWSKEKVGDGTFVIEKEDSKVNKYDIGIKGESKFIFEYPA